MDKNLNPSNLSPEEIRKTLELLLNDRTALIETTKQSFFWFFYIYFGRYFTYPVAPFHMDMINIAQDENIKRAAVMAFRGSAKSTILNTAFALWCVMGAPQKKHIVIASQTQQRAKDHLMNCRKEIEENDLMSENMGPYKETEDRWHSTTLIIPKYGARITAISAEEGVRGLREGPHRPDVMIVDDVEDSTSAKTIEGRDKTFNWLTGELIPLGEIDTRVIILGNFIQDDSALSRIEEKMHKGEMDGVFLKIPIVDDEGKPTWPAKFPDIESVEKFKRSIGNELTWQRDYMLVSIPDDFQIIIPTWIKRYDKLPDRDEYYIRNIMFGFQYCWASADMAISLKQSADFTAIVSAEVYRDDHDLKIYILPNVINKHVNFTQAIDLMKNILDPKYQYCVDKLFIESNNFQSGYYQQLIQYGYHNRVYGVRVNDDKRTRLSMISKFIENGTILFPKTGAEMLITQLVGFGREHHEDLVDALTMLVSQILQEHEHSNELRTYMRGSKMLRERFKAPPKPKQEFFETKFPGGTLRGPKDLP